MIGLAICLSGVALAVVGLFLLFGPLALVGSGVAIAAAGLLIDWEAMHDEHPAPPPL